MPLTYVLDEHLRRLLWRAIQHHNAAGQFAIDVVQVGDPVDLPLGSTDPAILLWAEKEDRVVVSRDYNTMPNHLAPTYRLDIIARDFLSSVPMPRFGRSLIILSSLHIQPIPHFCEISANTSPNLR